MTIILAYDQGAARAPVRQPRTGPSEDFPVDKIAVPLLIAQGANGPRVPRAESEMIVAALKAKGKDVEYLLYPDEGHGFARPQNRLSFYERAERFLARHLLCA